MNKVPVFLHIPKNAGTYVLSWIMKLFRYYGIAKKWNNHVGWNLCLRRLLITHENRVILTAFVYDKTNECKSNSFFNKVENDEYCNQTTLLYFLSELLNKRFFVFALIIEADGFSFFRQGLMVLFNQILDTTSVCYMILREPFDRAKSMYSYINSTFSAHEPTHNNIKSKTFHDYINSSELEDSWLIRNLVGVSNNEEIQNTHYNDTCKLLHTFKIKDISKVDDLINEVFLECHNIAQSSIPDHMIDINLNNNSKKNILDTISLNSLDEHTKNTFLKRTHYERLLYSNFCKS